MIAIDNAALRAWCFPSINNVVLSCWLNGGLLTVNNELLDPHSRQRIVIEVEVATELKQRRTTGGCPRRDNLGGAGIGYATDHGDASFEDARFLGSDLDQRITEDVLMVQADRSDRGDAGRADVGAIESPSQSDFHHDRITLRGIEVHQGDCRGQLEKRKRSNRLLDQFGDRFDTLNQRDQLLARTGLAIDAKSFFQAMQVRRGVETGSQTGCRKCRSHHCGGRAFSLSCRRYAPAAPLA